MFVCKFCQCHRVEAVEMKSVIVKNIVNFVDSKTKHEYEIKYGKSWSRTESTSHFACAGCDRIVANSEEELLQIVNEQAKI